MQDSSLDLVAFCEKSSKITVFAYLLCLHDQPSSWQSWSILAFYEWWIPFEDNHKMVSPSTVVVASPEIHHDLLAAYAIRKITYDNFQEERWECDPPAVKFHDGVTKTKLITITDVSEKAINLKANEWDIVLKADRRLFEQMILIVQSGRP